MNEKSFNLQNTLKRKRDDQRTRAFLLLWENIDTKSWGTISPPLTDSDKVKIQASHSFSSLAQFFVLTGQVIQSLRGREVREILQYGGSRRIGSIRNAVQRILEIAPIDRKARLTIEESNILSDSILLLYVHMLGVLDAFAIALLRTSSAKRADEKRADLISKSFRQQFDLPELDDLFSRHDAWLTRVKDELRNRYVHRIPPYVPDARFSQEEGEKYAILENCIFELILSGDFDGAERMRLEQDALGSFWPVIAFTETGAVMHLHMTILDDVYRFICLIYDTLAATLPKLQEE